ncbi:MAG: carbohydrate kinase, partial [Spirochaetes bacterium]|nr:carbohydrate kinase [Spirochaetota bacterium]
MSASGDLALSIDCGTQSVRALAFDASGRLVAKRKVDYQPYFSSRPGWAEQDPELWWNALVSGCRALVAELPGGASRVAAMAVTTQRDSMICLDADARPVRPAILWIDSRKAQALYRPGPLTRLGLALVGMDEAVKKTQESGACNWIMQNDPESWA